MYSIKWRLRDAVTAAVQRFRRPLIRFHSSDWSADDHGHICLALRLLDEDDFVAVCPKHGKCFPECDDCCDVCHYLKTVEFCSGDYGKYLVIPGALGQTTSAEKS